MPIKRHDPLSLLSAPVHDPLEALLAGSRPDEDESSAEIRAAIGDRLRQLRKRAGLTQTELGIRAGGIRAGEISRFENGERLPSIDTLARLSQGLGVALREMVSFRDEGDPAMAQVDELATRLQGQSPEMVRMAIAVIDALIRTA